MSCCDQMKNCDDDSAVAGAPAPADEEAAPIGGGKDDAPPAVERVLCFSTLLDNSRRQTTIFRHPIFSYKEELAWPPRNWEELHCWHCCSKLLDPPVPLAQDMDPDTGRYVVYGIFCSFSCAKAYIYETQPWSAGGKLLLLEDMAVSAFGSEEPILPAPPRQRLRIFGGDLTPEEFHKERHIHALCSPPLITYPEVYEREVMLADPPTEAWSVCGQRSQPLEAANSIRGGGGGGKAHLTTTTTMTTSAASSSSAAAGAAAAPRARAEEEDIGKCFLGRGGGGGSAETSLAGSNRSSSNNNPYANFCQRGKSNDGNKGATTTTTIIPRTLLARDDARIVPGTLSAYMRKPKSATAAAPPAT